MVCQFPGMSRRLAETPADSSARHSISVFRSRSILSQSRPSYRPAPCPPHIYSAPDKSTPQSPCPHRLALRPPLPVHLSANTDHDRVHRRCQGQVFRLHCLWCVRSSLLSTMPDADLELRVQVVEYVVSLHSASVSESDPTRPDRRLDPCCAFDRRSQHNRSTSGSWERQHRRYGTS